MFEVIADNGNSRVVQTRAEAEDVKSDMERLGMTVEINSKATDGGTNVEVPADDQRETDTTPTGDISDTLAERDVSTDPLDILPGYMIDIVKGTATLNKRGLSVLAFEYDVSIENREIIVSPHESEWEHAIVETTVTNSDGNRFVGTGTAHIDRGDDAETLLEMAETRSYKRAVSFATGTGIVSYQEMVSELE